MYHLLASVRVRLALLAVVAVLPGLVINLWALADGNTAGDVVLDLLMLGLGVVLALGLAWWLANIFVMHRLGTLVQTTKKLAAGDLEARTGLHYEHGELGQLAQAIDEMAGALAEHQKRVFQEEELRQQNAALAEASRLKSEFLANMSHELRTPLNSIIGFSDLLLGEPPGGYDHATRTTYTQTIRDSGAHLLGLINDILDISKVEAGKMDLHPECFPVSEVVEQVCRTVRPVADRKGIVVLSDTGWAGDLVADQAKVRQVLYNLLSNAVKFTPDTGRVTVSAHRRAEDILFVVADTGIGIAAEDQKRIFEAFHQVDTGANRVYQGTGLGLALTQRLVDLHGGTVWVQSELGEGTRFYVSLPLCPPGWIDTDDEVASANNVVPVDWRNRPLVLIVEDDRRAAQLLNVYLRQGGYATVVVSNGRQVLERARELQPAAITLDILLPGIDGWEVLNVLKEDEATRGIPVVIVSVADEDSLGRALGAVDYFVKPVDPQALLALLRRHALVPSADGESVRVLVVDDEVAGLDLLTAMLEPAGYTVFRAGGGAEGIALARQVKPDLVLLDLIMPEVSGFDVVASLKADPATRRIPIVVISAKELTDQDKAMLNGHVAAMLEKGTLGGVELLGWLDELVHREPELLGRAS